MITVRTNNKYYEYFLPNDVKTLEDIWTYWQKVASPSQRLNRMDWLEQNLTIQQARKLANNL